MKFGRSGTVGAAREGARFVLDRMDGICASIQAAVCSEPHLTVALFHAVHRTRQELDRGTLAPNQRVTLEDLRRFLDAMLNAGYQPVACDRLAEPTAGGKRLLLTFDDGYFNNAWVVPLLEEFQVPAMFFVTSSHVREGKAFWWDALARALRKQGKNDDEINATLRNVKRGRSEPLEAAVRREFGSAALQPTSDLDRPFSPSELRDVARNRWVSIGNHTSRHDILTSCDAQTMKASIADGQRELLELVNQTPAAIAYPNGNYSAEVIDAAIEQGLSLGFTTMPRANPLPSPNSRRAMALGRHLIWGGRDYAAESRTLGASMLPGAALRSQWRRFS